MMILHQDLPPNPLQALSDYSGSCWYPPFDKLGSLSLPTYDGAVCLTAQTIGLDWKKKCCSFNICLFLAVPGVHHYVRAFSSCGMRVSHCGGFSCCGAQALGTQASVAVVHGLSCSAACGIFLNQGSNPCPLHWHTDSKPLDHLGSPRRGYSNLYAVLFKLFHGAQRIWQVQDCESKG